MGSGSGFRSVRFKNCVTTPQGGACIYPMSLLVHVARCHSLVRVRCCACIQFRLVFWGEGLGGCSNPDRPDPQVRLSKVRRATDDGHEVSLVERMDDCKTFRRYCIKQTKNQYVG